jgi:hypothetical protein
LEYFRRDGMRWEQRPTIGELCCPSRVKSDVWSNADSIFSSTDAFVPIRFRQPAGQPVSDGGQSFVI